MASLPERRCTNPAFCRRERLHVLYIIANHKPLCFSVNIFHCNCRNKSALITPACWDIKIFISSQENHDCKRQGQLTPSGNSSSIFFLVVLVLNILPSAEPWGKCFFRSERKRRPTFVETDLLNGGFRFNVMSKKLI